MDVHHKKYCLFEGITQLRICILKNKNKTQMQNKYVRNIPAAVVAEGV